MAASRSDIQARLWRRLHPRRRIGMALGVFDFCHAGHVNLLRKASARCDRLVVGVHTDAEVERYKGVRPMNSALERAARLRALGLADVVEIESDRVRLCRRHGVDVVFHGDDWDRETYLDHFGRERIAALGLEVEILPHTPGIDATRLRRRTPRVGWWVYSPNPGWGRAHIVDHLDHLYGRVGGVWIAGRRGRATVKARRPDAPCAWLPDGTALAEACGHVAALQLDVLVTAHFDYAPLVAALERRGHPVCLAVLSHGRSGKPGASADVHRRAGGEADDRLVVRRGCVTVHDWSADRDAYGHLDAFLADGGSLRNPAPARSRPRLLVLPTWGGYAYERGLLLSRRWRGALRRLARDWDVVVSPHPLASRLALRRLTWGSGVRLLPAEGRSFAAVPDADVVLSDLSGVFWEALLFDTPVLLVRPTRPYDWPDDLPPSLAAVEARVPLVAPRELPALAERLRGSRAPGQHELAVQRLGPVDGRATERVAERLLALLEATGAGPAASLPRR